MEEHDLTVHPGRELRSGLIEHHEEGRLAIGAEMLSAKGWA